MDGLAMLKDFIAARSGAPAQNQSGDTQKSTSESGARASAPRPLQPPADAFLDEAAQRYLVKSQTAEGGGWEYEPQLLAEAKAKATQYGEPRLAARADQIERELGTRSRAAFGRAADVPLGWTFAKASADLRAGMPTAPPNPAALGAAQRYVISGALDLDAMAWRAVGALRGLSRGEVLQPLEAALLTALYPGEVELVEPAVAAMLAPMTDAERERLRGLVDARVKEVVATRQRTFVPGQSVTL